MNVYSQPGQPTKRTQKQNNTALTIPKLAKHGILEKKKGNMVWNSMQPLKFYATCWHKTLSTTN